MGREEEMERRERALQQREHELALREKALMLEQPAASLAPTKELAELASDKSKGKDKDKDKDGKKKDKSKGKIGGSLGRQFRRKKGASAKELPDISEPSNFQHLRHLGADSAEQLQSGGAALNLRSFFAPLTPPGSRHKRSSSDVQAHFAGGATSPGVGGGGGRRLTNIMGGRIGSRGRLVGGAGRGGEEEADDGTQAPGWAERGPLEIIATPLQASSAAGGAHAQAAARRGHGQLPRERSMSK